MMFGLQEGLFFQSCADLVRLALFELVAINCDLVLSLVLESAGGICLLGKSGLFI